MRRRPRGTSRRIPRRDVSVATDQELPALTGALKKAGGRWEGCGSEHQVKFGSLLRPGRFPDLPEARHWKGLHDLECHQGLPQAYQTIIDVLGGSPELRKALSEAPPCPVTGYVTSNEIKIILGEFGDIWPESVRPEGLNARRRPAPMVSRCRLPMPSARFGPEFRIMLLKCTIGAFARAFSAFRKCPRTLGN
jgi:hypothetical protein